MAFASSLFSVISPSFFSLLSSPNKETNFLLIAKTDALFGKNLTIDRARLVSDLADTIREMHITSLDEAYGEDGFAESETSGPQTKANNFVRALELKGWLDRDQDEDLNPIVQRTDGFVAVYTALCDLMENEVNAKEFATPLLSLYRNLKTFDLTNATTSMQAVENDSKALERGLLSINSRIKRFVGKAMADVDLSEKEILSKLTIDYQKLAAYTAFHNLMTRNNPNKYSGEIAGKVYELLNPAILEIMVSDYMKTKGIKNPDEGKKQEAKDYFEKILFGVEQQMEDIENSLNVISGRNHAYVRSSSERIRFRLNNERNIKGEITRILKQIKAMRAAAEQTIGDAFCLHTYNQSDNKSLYTAKAAARIAPKKVPFNKREVSEEARRRAEELIHQRDAFSVEMVNAFVMEAARGKKRLLASEIAIDSIDSFVKLVLVPVFSSNADSAYSVCGTTGNEFEAMGFIVEDYEIRIKEALK